jgi:hypothetical protein
MKTIKQLCEPRESAFEADRRATVLNLDSLLKEKVDAGAFFEENYFTNGMLMLVERALRHLGGSGAGSSAFVLSQAMGGGKTHSMIALGLLARDANLRKKILKDKNPAPNLGNCKVIGFNGRSSDAVGGIWGSLAEQLGKAAEFVTYVSPLLRAPGPEAWKKLLGDDPLVIFLDELPPYLSNAVAVPVGNGDLSVVTTTALANLLVAISELTNVCLVISDLAGTNYSGGQTSLEAAFNRAVQQITAESKRVAVPITPVNPNGDELYHILRKRLFQKTANNDDVEKVASGYRDSLREAVRMNLTTTTPESLYTRIVDSYPFHPDLRELVGKFKENEGFQQTRGVIRLMQMVVADLWNSKKADQLLLVHPYDLNLNHDEISSEVRTINHTLSEAIAHDVAHAGDSEVEQIDSANGNSDASEAARLILVASLSTTPGAIHGLREFQIVDCLQKPGRDLSTFKVNVVDKLATRAWYLHNSADGRLFFKNQQNLAAKLRSTAQSLHNETVERMLRTNLEEYFAASIRDCYQNIFVFPPLDKVQIDQEKTALVIIRPGGNANQLPLSSEWQDWWIQQQYKNRVIFLTGSRDSYENVLDTARQKRALQSIEDDLKTERTPTDDPQWRNLESLKDRVNIQYYSALKEAFDILIYPSLDQKLRSTGIDLAFRDNQNGEATIRKTLEGAQKFTTIIEGDSFRTRAEARLFGAPETKVILWADFKRNAAVTTNWPLHKLSALDDLKADCLRRGLWREEGNHIRRGPFPPASPEVVIRELSVSDEGSGMTFLKIEPLHAPSVAFESGDSVPTRASSPVPTPSRFEATGLRYSFLAFDPSDSARTSPVKVWNAKIRLKSQLHHRGNHHEAEFLALPKTNGIEVRYTTDGSSPMNAGSAVYNGVFRVPSSCRVIRAVAVALQHDNNSEIITVNIPTEAGGGPRIRLDVPARWTATTRLDDSGAVWEFIEKLRPFLGATATDITITLLSEDGLRSLDYADSIQDGYNADSLKSLVEKIQTVFPGEKLRMIVGSILFLTGQSLLDWLQATRQQFRFENIRQ